MIIVEYSQYMDAHTHTHTIIRPPPNNQTNPHRSAVIIIRIVRQANGTRARARRRSHKTARCEFTYEARMTERAQLADRVRDTLSEMRYTYTATCCAIDG